MGEREEEERSEARNERSTMLHGASHPRGAGVKDGRAWITNEERKV
jgi:hypothetical protein